MLTDRKLKLAWRAHLAELAAMQLAEHPSQAVIAERCREYFSWRLKEALEAPSSDSAGLAEVLIELLELVAGSEKVIGWEPLSIEEARARIGRGFRP